MNSTEKRRVETSLIALGLKGLKDPELLEQLANLVSNWPGDKHEFLIGLLNECDTAEQRAEMYQAIRPKLKFRALPLSTYEDKIRIKAGSLVSQRKMRVEGVSPAPIEIGGRQYYKVPNELSAMSQALVTLKCYKCQNEDQFLQNTPVAAMIEGRNAGWRRDPGVNKEMCPECVAKSLVSLEVQ